jgi:hypothetical protein
MIRIAAITIQFLVHGHHCDQNAKSETAHEHDFSPDGQRMKGRRILNSIA